MNDCDVQYRQSSNKRLLVELTLIQIGQITQPEDQDVPSAGRTPHRLKSLFQKIVAQLKPAAQGAGAGQDSSSKVATTASQPAATDTHTPTPTDAAPASGSATTPATAASATEAAKKRTLKNVNLSGIGMTFANLKKVEESARRAYNPIDRLQDEASAANASGQPMNQPFSQEQVEGQWISMCLRIQNVKDLIGLASRMKPIVPKITDFPNIEVVVDNQLLLDDILRIKNRIRSTFVQGLQNNELQITYRLAEANEVTKILSKRELLEKLKEENPAVGKLMQSLKLVLS